MSYTFLVLKGLFNADLNVIYLDTAQYHMGIIYVIIQYKDFKKYEIARKSFYITCKQRKRISRFSWTNAL